jgi:hypothetical protein
MISLKALGVPPKNVGLNMAIPIGAAVDPLAEMVTNSPSGFR